MEYLVKMVNADDDAILVQKYDQAYFESIGYVKVEQVATTVIPEV